MDKSFETILELAGIKGFRFHDLRHTYASYLALSGATVPDIAALLGHRNLEQSLIYTSLLPSEPRAAVERMMRMYLDDTPSAAEAHAHHPQGVGQRTAAQ